MKNALKAAGFGAGEPDRRIVVALAHLSAREIIQATIAAIAAAARRGSTRIEMDDLQNAIRMGEADGQLPHTSVH